MVEPRINVTEAKLFRRMRRHFPDDESCQRSAAKIVSEKMTVWPLPTLFQLHAFSTEQVLQALRLCPESDFFYHPWEEMLRLCKTYTKTQLQHMLKKHMVDKAQSCSTHAIEEEDYSDQIELIKLESATAVHPETQLAAASVSVQSHYEEGKESEPESRGDA